MKFPRRNLGAGVYWLKKGNMRSQRVKNKDLFGGASAIENKQCKYEVVLKFIEPKSEEERIERQSRVANVMIKNAIALAKKGISLVDKDSV